MLRVLLHGLNYKNPPTGMELPDCILDAERKRDWYEAYRPSIEAKYGGLSITLLTERTRDALDVDVAAYYESIGVDDAGHHFYSGHGTNKWRPGRLEEGDRKDEGLVGVDGLILWDNRYAELARRAQGPTWVILDSCFSGGMHRAAAVRDRFYGNATALPRYWPTADSASPFVPTAGRIVDVRSRRGLFAACQEHELAYSTGRGGAFSLAFEACWKPGMTWRELRQAITPAYVPTGQFPQTPRFDGGGDRDGLVLV